MLVQMSAQLPSRVVQGLVEGAAGRLQPVGEHVDRHAVDGQCKKDTALVLRQLLADRPLQRLQELALLGLGFGWERGAREEPQVSGSSGSPAPARLACGA